MDNCQVSGTYWPVRFAFGQCNWTSLPTRAALHNNTHTHSPAITPLPTICNAMPTSIIMLIIIMRFVALCQPQVLGAPECLLPLASFLLPAALWVVPVEWWLLLGGVGCCLVPQSSAYFTQSVGPASRYNLPLLPLPPPRRSTTFGRDLSCNLARKGEILVPHKLIPAMPFSRITNRRLAKHTNTHTRMYECASVCVCWHPLWRATAMSDDRPLGNWPRFRSS